MKALQGFLYATICNIQYSRELCKRIYSSFMNPLQRIHNFKSNCGTQTVRSTCNWHETLEISHDAVNSSCIDTQIQERYSNRYYIPGASFYEKLGVGLLLFKTVERIVGKNLKTIRLQQQYIFHFTRDAWYIPEGAKVHSC